MQDLSMHILDIVQNSVVAGATIVDVSILEDTVGNVMSFSVIDNGKGMDEEFLERVRNPFTTTRTTRKVGLGIPLLAQTCELSGGCLELTSTKGVGTSLIAKMQYDSIDRPPLGDIASTMCILFTTTESCDFRYFHKHDEKEYSLSTLEIKEVIGDVPLNMPDIVAWISDNLNEGVSEVCQ